MAIYGRDKIDIFSVFVETIGFFCKKFGSLAGIAVVFLLTTLTNGYFLQDRIALTVGFPRMDNPVIARILILIVSFLITIWVKAALINATAAQYQGRHFAYPKMIKDVSGKYWRILGTVLFLEAVLLIPAIYFPLRDAIIDAVSGSTMTLLGWLPCIWRLKALLRLERLSSVLLILKCFVFLVYISLLNEKEFQMQWTAKRKAWERQA